MTLMRLAAVAALVFLGGASFPAASEEPVGSSQGWDAAQRAFYYGTPQGTAMLPAALIQALEDEQGRPFMSRENLLRYGVIYPEAGLTAPNNPWGWPIGFVVDDIAALGGPQFSLTCAACHTGEIRRQGRRAIIEGGQATMDVVRMGGDWSAAFLATDADPSRRTRFLARAVALGHAPDRVEADFARIIEGIRAHAREQARRADTVAGPMRVDAVTSIATAVFAHGLNEPANIFPSDAPQSYPPLWHIWRFDWVQSNASARQPMTRNLSEAMGTGPNRFVGADGRALPAPGIWDSPYRVRNLAAIEEHLRELAPPSWPEPLLGAVDAAKSETGRAIFANTCAGCHAVQPIAGTDPVEWHVPVIPLDRIGTDPTLVLNFSGRRYDASKLGIAEKIDAVTGLAIVSEQIKARAYARAGVTAAEAPAMDGFGREPTLSPDTCGYKARPLIGMWATPPFLHNGSVPTIADLLSETRPERFAIGGNDYDPARLGLSHEAGEGALIYDTTLRGNGNGGHWFTDDISRPGRIGRALSPDERAALIEYLKSAAEATYPVRPVTPPLRRPTCPTDPDWAVKRLQAAAP